MWASSIGSASSSSVSLLLLLPLLLPVFVLSDMILTALALPLLASGSTSPSQGPVRPSLTSLVAFFWLSGVLVFASSLMLASSILGRLQSTSVVPGENTLD
jgi:hypothetical protein